MSFSQSSVHYKLTDGHILHATLKNNHGQHCDSTLDLNRYIGNSDGWFIWDGSDYSHSGHGFELQGNKLVGHLKKRDGGSRGLQGVNLDERITNNNGSLEFVRH